MKRQDFIKLVNFTGDKLVLILEMNSLLSGSVFIKNDPCECKLHICNEDKTWDFSFFEHDNYHNSKFEIDIIFQQIKDLYLNNENRN